jgi:hypothetical protein
MPVVFRFMNLKTFQCLRAFFVTYLDAFADKELISGKMNWFLTNLLTSFYRSLKKLPKII